MDHDALATGGGPIVLFDGVCNLCDASVRWLIRHDTAGTLRFASLQSATARRILEDRLSPGQVAALPDAIVLVDEAGVHVASDAAVRIAGHLRFPWSTLAVARLIPRVAREAIYRGVARNRYRWFGHRDVCRIPTPDVVNRFLDADETTAPPTIEDPADLPDDERRWLRSWAVRFAIAYLILYMAPFPLTLLSTFLRLPLISAVPGLDTAAGWITGLWGSLTTPLVSLTGNVVFGVDVEPRPTGSGDRMFNYVEIVVDVGMALVVSVGWTLAARARRISAMTFDVSRVLARYYLGTFLLIYGWIKVFPLQMPTPGPDRLLQPYGDSSPMGIAWTFIGVSMGYQIFSGLSELLAGYLLFWRRTAFAGSLVAMAVMLNVMAINYFYDVPVKLFSTHLFLFALFIAAPDLPRLVGMLGFNLPVAPDAKPAFWKRLGWSARPVVILNLALVSALTWFHVRDNLDAARTRGHLAEVSPLEGVYVVERFVQGGLTDRENEDDARWVRVGINMPSLATIQRATGVAVRGFMRMDVDGGTVSFYGRGEDPPASPQFQMRVPEPGLLSLDGTFEGRPTSVVMRKADGGGLLLERGFHWINEFPLNR